MSFKIEEFPSDTSQEYSAIAGTEGLLSLESDGKTIFRESGILLLEFALSLKAWLEKVSDKNKIDFFYSSMDFEEEPILAFFYRSNIEQYEIESVWKIAESFSTLSGLVEASRTFLHELSLELKSSYNYGI